MISNVILLAPGFTPSPPTLVNKTATTITVSWTPVPSEYLITGKCEHCNYS